MGLIDEAALCMLALSKMSACIKDDIEEELCRVFCCCKEHPVIQKKKLMQNCAHLMLKATHEPGCRYESSVPYRMDTLEPLKINPKTGRRMYMDESTGTRLPIRIPDVSAYDETGNLDTIYDFKFPGDCWRRGQKEAYEKLVGGNKEKVIKLDSEYCKCKNKIEDRSILTDEEKQAMRDQSNQYFMTNRKNNKKSIPSVMGGMNAAEPSALIPELTSAVHNAENMEQKLAPLSDISTWLRFGKPGKIGGSTPRTILPRPGFVPQH